MDPKRAMVKNKNKQNKISQQIETISTNEKLNYSFPNYSNEELKKATELFDLKEARDILVMLGFNLSANRVHGYEYVTLEYDSRLNKNIANLRWYTANNTEIENKYTYRVYKSGNDYKDKYLGFDDKEGRGLVGGNSSIRQHYLSRFITRKCQSNYFGFIDNTNLSYNITRFHKKGIGLSAHPKSRCIVFDIDAHDGDHERAFETLLILLKLFNYKQEAYIERSIQGGFHVGWFVDKPVSDLQLREFCRIFKKVYNLNLEPRLTTKPFRIPYHCTYTPGYLAIINRGGKYDVSYHSLGSQNNPFSFQQFHHIVKLHHVGAYGNKDNSGFYEYRSQYIENQNLLESYRIEAFINKHNQSQHSVKKTILSPYKSRVGSNREFRNNKYLLSRGNRDYNMFRLSLICRSNGNTFNEYFDILKNSFTDSNDWQKWSDYKRFREALRVWENSEKHIKFTNVKINSFVSSISYIPENILYKLKSPIITSCIMNQLGIKYGSNKDRIEKAVPIILQEMVGKYFYELSNRRSYDKSIVDPSLGEKICLGVQYPDEFCDRLKEHYKFVNIDVRKIVNTILKSGIFFKQYKHNELGYSHSMNGKGVSYCRQWYLKGDDLLRDDSVVSIRNFLRIVAQLNKLYTHNTSFLECLDSFVATVAPSKRNGYNMSKLLDSNSREKDTKIAHCLPLWDDWIPIKS